MTSAEEKKIRQANKVLFDKVNRQCNQNGICTGKLFSKISAPTFHFLDLSYASIHIYCQL